MMANFTDREIDCGENCIFHRNHLNISSFIVEYIANFFTEKIVEENQLTDFTDSCSSDSKSIQKPTMIMK